MRLTTPLVDYVAALQPGWKWTFGATIPPLLAGEWQAWLAEAQREEDDTLLRYWSSRGLSAA